MKTKMMVAVFCALAIAHGAISFSASLPGRDIRMESANQNAKAPAYEEIEKKMKELIDELEKLQKDASQKIRKELIPRLQKEIDRLKEWLRDFQSNPEKEPGTRET